MRGHGAIGGYLDEFEPELELEPELNELQEHEETGLLHVSHLLFLLLHPQEELDLLHELQTGESLKPSADPPTRTSIPSFLKPAREYAKLTIPTPPKTNAIVPIINMCFQVKFITPSNILE